MILLHAFTGLNFLGRIHAFNMVISFLSFWPTICNYNLVKVTSIAIYRLVALDDMPAYFPSLYVPCLQFNHILPRIQKTSLLVSFVEKAIYTNTFDLMDYSMQGCMIISYSLHPKLLVILTYLESQND